MSEGVWFDPCWQSSWTHPGVWRYGDQAFTPEALQLSKDPKHLLCIIARRATLPAEPILAWWEQQERERKEREKPEWIKGLEAIALALHEQAKRGELTTTNSGVTSSIPSPPGFSGDKRRENVP